MSILDVFKVGQYKKENEQLKKDLKKLKTRRLSVDQMTVLELKEEISKQEKRLKRAKKRVRKQKAVYRQGEKSLASQQEKLNKLTKQIFGIEDDLAMESFGLYTPRYDFASSLGYKEKLADNRAKQKQMIKDKSAVDFFDGWTVDGSLVKGKKMMNDNIKQILRSFNNECEAAINKVKYNNIESIKNRILKSFEQLNKMNESNRLSMTTRYLDLKADELYLAYEYERKKQEEKETLQVQRQKEREEKALQKEINSKKKVIDKDINHYKKLIDDLNKKLSQANKKNKSDIEKQIGELHDKVEEKREEQEELDYRTAHASAGYVYIISNIGAFGEDVIKIGVTRRLDPLERISELSSASVPFKFDIHALIFSYDAYKLETELHQYFNAYRVNKVNNRKEFFRVPIRQIGKKLEDYGELTIDFNEIADAQEYRESLNVI